MTAAAPSPVRTLIAVSGSIHAALLPTYLQLLRSRANLDMQIAMTRAATGIIPASTLAQYLGRPVYTDPWQPTPVEAAGLPAHVWLSQWAQQAIVLPATANILAKAAAGIADDLITTVLVAFSGPTLFAPAMNTAMWRAATVRRSVAQLREDGRWVLEPAGCPPTSTGTPGGGVSPSPRQLLALLDGSSGWISEPGTSRPASPSIVAGGGAASSESQPREASRSPAASSRR